MRNLKVAFVILSGLVFELLLAGVIPGRWEKVDALPEGSEVVLTMRSGERIRGALQNSSSDVLEIADPTEGERRVLKTDVLRVLHPPEQKDNTWDGAAIGAGVGFGLGFMIGGSAVKEGDETFGVGALVFGPVGAGVGLLLGYMFDSSRPKPDVLYQAAQ